MTKLTSDEIKARLGTLDAAGAHMPALNVEGGAYNLPAATLYLDRHTFVVLANTTPPDDEQIALWLELLGLTRVSTRREVSHADES